MLIGKPGAGEASLRETLRAVIERAFPERQLIYRSQAKVRYISLSRSSQMAISAVALVAMAWVIYASSHVYLSGRVLNAKDDQIAAMGTAYDSLTGEWANAQQRFLKVTDDLEAKHNQLLELFAHRTSLEKKLGSVSSELDLVMAQRDQALDLSGDLTKRVGLLEMTLRGVTSDRFLVEGFLSSTKTRLSTLSEKHRKALSAQTHLAQRVGELESTLRGVVQDKHSVQGELSSTKSLLNRLAEKHLAALLRQADLGREVAELETRLTIVKSSQRTLVERVKERTGATIRELESLVATTGLPPARLLERSAEISRVALGGPLVRLPSSDAQQSKSYPEMDDSFGHSVGELENLLQRWSSLQIVLQALPLTAPTKDHRIVSGWGKRRDPFTKRWAFHRGLDFAAFPKTPVLATAPGTVTFAGRKGPYGKLVEINHGMGVVTRFGHLRRIHVKKGQKVEFRQKIGQVGSTGRSTGPHVHYEIHFDGKAINPELFIKAGRHVFKD